MSKTETPFSNEDALKAAQALVGEDVTPVAKAADVKDEDKDEEKKEESKEESKDVEKSVTLTETELTALVASAVEKAIGLIDEKLEPVTKSLEAIKADGDTARTYLQANTKVLTKVKDQGEVYLAKSAELEEVTKSLKVDVEAIGDKPAAPRSVIVADETPVAKSAEVPAVDFDKVAEIAKGLDLADAVSFKAYMRQGQTDLAAQLISPAQRRALGIN